MYTVVFEYTDQAAARTGVRTWSTYHSKSDYLRHRRDIDLLKPIAEGVSDKEARDLTAQTREIARIRAAINGAFNDGVPSMIHHYLGNAIFAIGADRTHTNRPDYTGLGQWQMFVSYPEMDNPRDIFNYFAEATSDPDSGQVNLAFLNLAMTYAYGEVQLLYDRRHKS